MTDLQNEADFLYRHSNGKMKIMKFGGTSVGNPDRMRALIPLITDEARKIVVLSAMSGTTNSLVEICDLLYAGKSEEAAQKNEALRSKYHLVVNDLYSTDAYRQTGHELIDSHSYKEFYPQGFYEAPGKSNPVAGRIDLHFIISQPAA
jgi:aspartokinase